MREIPAMLLRFALRILRFFGTLFLVGLSLLPLSALLLAYPAINPQESVLSDTVKPRRNWFIALLLSLQSLLLGAVILIVMLAVAVELTTMMMTPRILGDSGIFGNLARGFLGMKPATLPPETLAKMSPQLQYFFNTPLSDQLPVAMVEHWPVVLLIMYLLDIVFLAFIGRIPLSYNLRNVFVRWKVTGLTLAAFAFVIGLLVFMLGFVKGMNDLTENTGIPGNVFVLSEGAPDELFSNLGYGDLDNVDRVKAELDANDNALKKPIGVKTFQRDGKPVFLASRETYYVINQPIKGSNPPKRRFVQLRSLEDAEVGAKVHEIKLQSGEWFSRVGVDNSSRIQCVLGNGVAGTLGADVGKKSLEVGDEFEMGDMKWIVSGVMAAEGTTFGSEIWVQRFDRITKPFGKDRYTTLVMRVDDDNPKTQKFSSQALAAHLSKRYTQQKLKAFSEPDYYAELTKTNKQFLYAIIFIAAVMSIGGVFGMMTTMFASINQRIRDIGVLRLLGFKRWQLLVSFMLESLVIALIGGGIGTLSMFLFTQIFRPSATSTLSSGGGGGGKNFSVVVDVNFQIVIVGILLTLVMGRLGGLVPALSAMRMKVLDSLR